MTHNNKLIIHDKNMEIVINSDEPISQTKKPEFNIDENIDENIGIRVPVYYIIFTIIDCDSSKHIRKKYVESEDKCRYYYYYITDSDNCNNCDYIRNDNIKSFMWCITKC